MWFRLPSICFYSAPTDTTVKQHIFALVLALVVGATSGADAQVTPEPLGNAETVSRGAPPEAQRKGRTSFIDTKDGQLDLSNYLETPRAFLPIPIVITEPAVGYGGGGAALFLRPRREAGDEGWVRPDISVVGAIATENGTRAAFAADASRWLDGRLRTLVGAGTGRVNLDFYGFGLDRPSFDQTVRYSLKFSGAVAQANWQLAPKSPWALGLRYVYADVEPQLRDDPAFSGLADRVRVKVAGPTPVLEFDTRDNIFTPTRGAYAESSWLASRKALGASDDFDRFQQTVMGWQPLAHNVTIGARANFGWSSNGTPFFLRPFVMLRGVPAMRFQGERMASVEVEARWQFSGRWSVVGFGGAGATQTTRDSLSVSQNVGSGGFGFRYELARKFGLHAGVDVAHSPGTTAVYLQVGSTWARP
jgi:hypothetical protein